MTDNLEKIILDTPRYKYEFNCQHNYDEAMKQIYIGGEYVMGYPLKLRTLLQLSDVAYDKVNKKYLKHRFVGDIIANKILDFAKGEI